METNSDLIRPILNSTEFTIVCRDCGRLFRSATSLSKHRIRKHGHVPTREMQYKCKEFDCNRTFYFLKQLKKHLWAVHGMTFHQERRTFASEEDYNPWRDMTEHEYGIRWTLHSRTKQNDVINAIFRCHKSCDNEPKNADKSTKPIVKNVFKITCPCTVSLQVKLNASEGSVSVFACFTHYGHEVDAQHLPLPQIGESTDVEPDFRIRLDSRILAMKKRCLAVHHELTDILEDVKNEETLKDCVDILVSLRNLLSPPPKKSRSTNVRSKNQPIVSNVGSENQPLVSILRSEYQPLVSNVGSENQPLISNVGSENQSLVCNVRPENVGFASNMETTDVEMITVTPIIIHGEHDYASASDPAPLSES